MNSLHPPTPPVPSAENAQRHCPTPLDHPVHTVRGAVALGVAFEDGVSRFQFDPPGLGIGKVSPGHVRAAVPGLKPAPLSSQVALAPCQGVPASFGRGRVWYPRPVDVGHHIGEVGRDGGVVDIVFYEDGWLQPLALAVHFGLPLHEGGQVLLVGELHLGGPSTTTGVQRRKAGAGRGAVDDGHSGIPVSEFFGLLGGI